MSLLLRSLLLAAALLAPAADARAVSIVTLALDPTASTLVPESGPAQTLAGTLTLRVGALPPGGTGTSLDVAGLALTASGGGTIGLDPTLADPGLGVLRPSGEVLIPTLFLRLEQGGEVLHLAIPDVTGIVTFGPGGASLARLDAQLAIATGGPAGLLTVTIAALPEPASAALLSIGLAALAARGARAEVRR
jgi:hypothetical protein